MFRGAQLTRKAAADSWMSELKSGSADHGRRFFGARLRRAELRQIGIEKTERVRWFDDADTGSTLFFDDLIAKGLHPGPMNLRPEMMFGVVTVKEPEPIIKLLVTAHAPGD